VRANKRLGQNFLRDERVIESIISAVAPTRDDTIIEIGPGRGALTGRLIDSAGRVIAIEFDSSLAADLRKQFGNAKNFTLLEADVLAVDFCSLLVPGSLARVAANLPYYISTAILQYLIEKRDCLADLTLMLQREVVDRIIAEPGNSDRGYLSVLVQAYCSVEPLFDVPPESFHPVPKIWSTVARFRFASEPLVANDLGPLLRNLLGASFAQKRKTLLNNLKSAPPALGLLIDRAGGGSQILKMADIEPRARAEALEMEEWKRIVTILAQDSN
jgi:16S rRNA (adenine1518-N6/adenine1519-N6)-dimethyltransferase